MYLEQTFLAVAIPYVDMTISTTSGKCPIAAKVLYNSGIVIEATRESQVFIASRHCKKDTTFTDNRAFLCVQDL